MTALTELQHAQQVAGENRRRWFSSPDMDLIAWYEEGDTPIAFELYYDKSASEHVFIWRKDSGYGHMAVDDGEQKPALSYKEAPILVPDGKIDANRIADLFVSSAGDLPAGLVGFVLGRIRQHPKYLSRI